MENRMYAAIDLKSFYASVECVERGLDPLSTNLVVADAARTEKTICLAVSPSLKAYGIPGRPRLFEVVAKVREVNKERKSKAPNRNFTGQSYNSYELMNRPDLELCYITAVPRMAHYMEYSARIYNTYLKYIAPEDIHVYSIDEVFMDVTDYLKTYHMTPRELVRKMIADVYEQTGITATAGIGTNLYLCKVAMDIVAKHLPPDGDGVRIAELDEYSYRRELWTHRPLTDFWRIGHGYAKKLEAHGLMTMGDVARCSVGRVDELYNEDLLYRLFGIQAELLIDHAWGWEPCRISDIKQYKPENGSLSQGQVLHCPYDYEKAKLIVKEMTEQLVLDLIEKRLVTNQIILTIGYDIANVDGLQSSRRYQGEIKEDRYGRKVPKQAHGSANLGCYTSSVRLALDAVMEIYEKNVDPNLLIRRISVAANRVVREEEAKEEAAYEQLSLFADWGAEREEQKAKEEALKKERQMQDAVLSIKKKFGKNAIMRGMSLQEGATARDRNNQIGGHKA